MGTSYNLKIVPGNRVFDMERVKARVQSELDYLESLMSTYQESSEITQFNRAEVAQEYKFSPETFEVLAMSENISDMSSGAFDITVGPLVSLWGFGPGKSRLAPPDADNIRDALTNIGYSNLILDKENSSAKKVANIQLDLSAIAKGYAVDRVASVLEEVGVLNYLVEVGGETKAKGVNDKGLVWRLGIEKPDELGRNALAVIEVDGMALATSGDYRNYFMSDGKRFSHTIDPKTGAPVEHQLASVSVLAKSCIEADAFATALLVLGEEKGFDFAKKHNLNAYFIYRDADQYKIRVTDGFKPHLLQ